MLTRILTSTFSTHFVHSDALSQKKGAFLCHDEIHNCRCWRESTVCVIICNIFKIKDSFILLSNNVTSCKGSCASGCTCLIKCDIWICFSTHRRPNCDDTDEMALSIMINILLSCQQQHTF